MSIFIDIRKAFDTVDFKILLDRLKCMGIRGTSLQWFESYLLGRSLRVVLNDVTSSSYRLKCGVPQGSVLGPLLYLVYVDAVRFYLQDVCVTTFADDTALTVCAKSIEELVLKANDALRRLEVFMNLSLLCVNVKKTFLMTFCRVGMPVDASGLVTLSGKPVQQVHIVRYLGFFIDSNLSWKHHSDVISAKIARGVGMLRRLKHFLPKRVLLMIYHSIVYPYISYGCLIWSSNFYSNFKRVQILQNKAVRIIGKYVKDVNDTSACFKSLNLLNVGQLRDYQAAVFVFQCVHNLVPSVFRDTYRANSDIHEYDTRNSDKLVIELKSSTRSGFRLQFLGTAVWNSLPVSIRAAEHLLEFKRKLKEYLIKDA